MSVAELTETPTPSELTEVSAHCSVVRGEERPSCIPMQRFEWQNSRLEKRMTLGIDLY
jgi:hypothetical protein